MSNKVICPFSKPIIGGWCRCDYANLAERCSGKMSCKHSADYLEQCDHLVELLRENSRFVLALTDDKQPLTHAQLMKIRWGGVQGLHRLFAMQTELPDVRAIIERLQQDGGMDAFNYSEIMPDIKHFSHRESRR